MINTVSANNWVLEGVNPHAPHWNWAELRAECEREALRLTRNTHDAEDVAQEAMTRAWRKRHSCRDAHSPRAWVRQIARNEAFRAMGRAPADTLVDDFAGVDAPAVAARMAGLEASC